MKLFTENRTAKEILINALLASLGLFLFGAGVWLTITAGLGAAPWDVFCLGLSGTFGILYGNASIGISVILLIIDILMKESIGIGLILDAVVVGKTVDLLNLLHPLSTPSSPVLAVIMLLAGIMIEVYSQYFYMKAALGCGPRDTLLVGLKRHLTKVPIGPINIFLMATVTFAGWLLGGPVGPATVICAFCTGPTMQFAFRTVRFDPTAVRHQTLPETVRVLLGRNRKNTGKRL